MIINQFATESKVLTFEGNATRYIFSLVKVGPREMMAVDHFNQKSFPFNPHRPFSHLLHQTKLAGYGEIDADNIAHHIQLAVMQNNRIRYRIVDFNLNVTEHEIWFSDDTTEDILVSLGEDGHDILLHERMTWMDTE